MNTDPGNADDGTGDRSPKCDDIRIEYHPNSGREPETFAFEDFVRAVPDSVPPVDPDPWKPFRTREDFEFTQLALDSAMSKAQVNEMIGLIHRCTKGEKSCFTLSSYDEMHKTLAVASERLPKVRSQAPLFASLSLILHYSSSKRKPSLKLTAMSHTTLMSGCVRYGHGLKICCKTQISSDTLCGMHVICQSLMESQTLGFDFTMNHGRLTGSGKSKYVVSILYHPACC